MTCRAPQGTPQEAKIQTGPGEVFLCSLRKALQEARETHRRLKEGDIRVPGDAQTLEKLCDAVAEILTQAQVAQETQAARIITAAEKTVPLDFGQAEAFVSQRHHVKVTIERWPA